MTHLRRSVPAPVIAIHVLAMVGVLFWLSQVITAFRDDCNPWAVLATAVVLGGAHVAISVLTARHSRRAIGAMWFVFLGDALLTALVDWRAILLVAFTAVLLLLTRPASAHEWFRRDVHQRHATAVG